VCCAMALAGQEVHGTVSEVSCEFGISRPTVYEARSTAGEVFWRHFEKEESAYLAVCAEVDEAQPVGAMVALCVLASNAMGAVLL
jgi:hypothetical protein